MWETALPSCAYRNLERVKKETEGIWSAWACTGLDTGPWVWDQIIYIMALLKTPPGQGNPVYKDNQFVLNIGYHQSSWQQTSMHNFIFLLLTLRPRNTNSCLCLCGWLPSWSVVVWFIASHLVVAMSSACGHSSMNCYEYSFSLLG